jgi:hypothetical protein
MEAEDPSSYLRLSTETPASYASCPERYDREKLAAHFIEK